MGNYDSQYISQHRACIMAKYDSQYPSTGLWGTQTDGYRLTETNSDVINDVASAPYMAQLVEYTNTSCHFSAENGDSSSSLPIPVDII